MSEKCQLFVWGLETKAGEFNRAFTQSRGYYKKFNTCLALTLAIDCFFYSGAKQF